MGEDEKHNILSVDVSDNALGDEGGAGGALVFRQIWKIWWFYVILLGGLEHFFIFFPSIGNFIIPTDDFFSEGFVETTNQLSLNGN